MELEVREIEEKDRGWLREFFIRNWGSPQMVYSHGVYECDQLTGYAAWCDGEVVGVVTFADHSDSIEVVSLDSLHEGRGIGTLLLQAVETRAIQKPSKRIWLLTTNDNLDALAFYQKKGFELVQVHRRAVEAVRQKKPQIPLVSSNGIPIRDEIELEKRISEVFTA